MTADLNAAKAVIDIATEVVDRATKNLLFVSARIKDERGNICSRATGIVSLLEEVRLEDWVTALGPAAEAR